MVSDLFASLVRRELHCTHFRTWRLPQEPARGLPEGHLATRGMRRQWALVLSLEFITLPLVRLVPTGRPPACFAQSAKPPPGGLLSLLHESIRLFSALGETIPVREPGWGALPWAKSGSELTCQDFMFLLGGPPPFLGRKSLSSFAGYYRSHIPISHTDSGAGTASRTSPGPQLSPISLRDTSSLSQTC